MEPELSDLETINNIRADELTRLRGYCRNSDLLISEEVGFISGQNFVVDGGMTKKMIYWE